jgi:hypothetical protein
VPKALDGADAIMGYCQRHNPATITTKCEVKIIRQGALCILATLSIFLVVFAKALTRECSASFRLKSRGSIASQSILKIRIVSVTY